jgi:hypothetical protein
MIIDFPIGGKDMLLEFPIMMTQKEAENLIIKLANFPDIVEKLERSIRIKHKGACYIGLSLDLEIIKLVALK